MNDHGDLLAANRERENSRHEVFTSPTWYSKLPDFTCRTVNSYLGWHPNYWLPVPLRLEIHLHFRQRIANQYEQSSNSVYAWDMNRHENEDWKMLFAYRLPRCLNFHPSVYSEAERASRNRYRESRCRCWRAQYGLEVRTLLGNVDTWRDWNDRLMMWLGSAVVHIDMEAFILWKLRLRSGWVIHRLRGFASKMTMLTWLVSE